MKCIAKPDRMTCDRFQEQRPSSEEDSDCEDAAEEFVEALEDFQGMLNICPEAASKDEAEGKMPLSSSSSGFQCKRG